MDKLPGVSGNRHQRWNWRSVGSNETRFFRFREQYYQLETHLINVIPGASKVRVLSAGASTGEEPTSILITFFRALEKAKKNNPGIKQPELEIIAIDINPENIKKFKANQFMFNIKFHKDTLRGWRRFFERSRSPGEEIYPGPDIYRVKLRPQFHEMIKYAVMDLRDSRQLTAFAEKNGRGFEAVFFNMVSLYLSDSVSQRVKTFLRQKLLAPSGLLFNRE